MNRLRRVVDIYKDPPPDADSQFSGVQMDQSPYVTPPEDARWFIPAGLAALPVTNGIANRVEIVKPTGSPGAGLPYTIPRGYSAVIKKIALVMQGNGSLDFSGDWVFQVFIDTYPVQNYESITYTVGSIAQPSDTFIQINSEQTIHIYAYSQHVAGTGNALALIEGYQWSMTRQQSYLTRGLQ